MQEKCGIEISAPHVGTKVIWAYMCYRDFVGIAKHPRPLEWWGFIIVMLRTSKCEGGRRSTVECYTGHRCIGLQCSGMCLRFSIPHDNIVVCIAVYAVR